MYPALAVVEEWKNASASGDLPELEAVLYIGTAGGLESRIVTRAGVDFRAVQAGALRGLSPWRALANSWALLRGTIQAWRILRAFRPDVLLATGGYASAPVVMAAWLSGCPALIYLPDILPGLAIRFLSYLAKRVAVSFDASLAYFPSGKAVVTGYPVRPALYQGNRTEARQRLGLALDGKVVLVLGGSRGAHSINGAVADILEPLLGKAQLLHVAGEKDAAWLQGRRDALPDDLRPRYHVYGYLHEEMTDALLAADLAIARAGAATMGEFAAVGLPAILVPYPYAGQHQEANADFMVSRGAALKVSDDKLAEGVLAPLVEELLANEQRLRTMADNARKLAKPDAARAIAQQLALLAGGV